MASKSAKEKAASCTIEELPNDPDPSKFDKSLGDILINGYDGNSVKFLTTVLGFLKRKSNFFIEPLEAKKKILDAFAEVAGDVDAAPALKTGFLGASKPAPAAPAATTSKADQGAEAAQALPAALQAAASAAAAASPPPAAAAAPAASAPDAAESAPAAAAAAAASASSEDDHADIPDAVEEKDEKPKGIKPNAARGADMEKYSWGQTLSECTVSVGVPAGTRAKMMDVKITKTMLRVGVKGQPPILEGDLAESVKPDDCMWNMVDNTVEVSLQKADGMHWWSSILKGDPIIDVQKVEPENSKLGDLDAETRQTVEKMMFDQRQKAMGRPSSDEMQKEDMMKKFMSAHPEMDFSKAKFT